MDLEAELVPLHILLSPAGRIYRQIHKGFAFASCPHDCGQRGTIQTEHALNLYLAFTKPVCQWYARWQGSLAFVLQEWGERNGEMYFLHSLIITYESFP